MGAHLMAEDVLVLQDILTCTEADWAAWKADKTAGRLTDAPSGKLAAKRSTTGVMVQTSDRQSNPMSRLGSMNRTVSGS